MGELPHDGRRDVFVVVAQDVANPRDLMPGDVGMTGFEFRR
jgi:hypothetical protein